MIRISILKSINKNGGQHLNNNTVTSGSFGVIEVLEPTIITTLFESNIAAEPVDVLNEWNLSGKILNKGIVIAPKRACFSSIGLSYGSVILRNS